MNLDLDALRRLDAPRPTSAALDDARDAARERLLATIAAGSGAPPESKRTTRRSRRVATSALATCTLTAVLLVGGLLGSRAPRTPAFWNAVVDVTHPPVASAAPALRGAARAAAAQTARPFTAGSVWVTRTRESELIVDRRGFASVQPTTVELTTNFEGAVHMRTAKAGPLQLMNRASLTAWRDAGSPMLGGGGYDGVLTYPKGDRSDAPYQFGGRFRSYRELLALPRDPEALGRELRAAVAAGPTPANSWFQLNAITDLMERVPLPPDLRAGLWRVAADLPGIKLVGRQADRLGRSGTAVVVKFGHEWRQVVFDPRTGALLASRIVNLRATTTCDRDMAPCRDGRPTAEGGQHRGSRKVIAPAGSVEYEKLYLSMEVRPAPVSPKSRTP